MEEYKVSCIIPAYNAATTLPRMLKAVTKQKYENVEIICVNDGSTDRTWEVINEWAAKDNRIVPLNVEHGGVGRARNAGIEAATGEFICFFDADDSIYSGTIKRHVKRMSKEGVVLSIGEVVAVHMNEEHLMKATVRLGENSHIRKYTKSLNWSMSVWNKCYRRDLILKNNLRFNDTRHGEDGVFVFSYIHSTDGIIAGIPHRVYRYVKKGFDDDISLSKRIDLGAINSIKSNMSEIVRIIDKSIAADKAALEGTTELTTEQVQVKLNNMEEYRSNLFRRFVDSTILNMYYRYVWNTGEGVFDVLKELYSEYMSNILDADKEKLYSHHEDLRIRNGLKPMEELAASPLITIVISDTVPEDRASALVNKYYNQDFPAFEILAGERFTENVAADLKNRLNYHVLTGYKEKNFRQTALAGAKGRYILFADEYTFPSTSMIKKMFYYMEDQNADMVTGKMMNYSNGKVRNILSEENTEESSSDGTLSAEDHRLVYSEVWSNILFRTDRLRKSKSFASGAGKQGCIRKLYSELNETMYTEDSFITGLNLEDFIDKLGLLEKRSLKKKLR